MAAEKTKPQPTEYQKVVEWRASVALMHGADKQLAASIGMTVEIDLHRWIKMVESGCDPRLAFRILEP